MKNLVSKNPVQRFKQKNFRLVAPVTTLKTGGNILKFKKPSGPLRLNDKYKTKQFGDEKREQALKEFTDKGVEFVKNTTQPMQQHTAKASKRNKNMAALQLQLWNSGAFKGVIDKRTGKQVTYERAVDGYDGKMTRQAQDNYQKIRESIQINSPQQQNNQKSKGGLASLYEMTHAAQTGGMSRQPQIKQTPKGFSGNSPIGMVVSDAINANVNRLSRLFTGKPAIVPDTITTLPQDQMDALKKLIKSTGRKEGTFTSNDWKNYKGNYTGGNRSMSDRISSPEAILEHTLGQFNFKRDNNGNLIVSDTYDFNVGEGSPEQGWYTAIRKIAGITNSRNTDPNKGKFIYNINLGK